MNIKKHITLKNICTILGVAIAMVTLLLNTYLTFMSDTIKRANAGDQSAQLFLANHYKKVGDYANSLYWYKAASVNKQTKEAGIAFNNLAFLYYNNFVPDDYSTASPTYYDTIFYCFDRSKELGNQLAAKH